MTTIPVRLKQNGYPIFIGSNILKDLPVRLKELNLGPDVVIITNPTVKRLYGSEVTRLLERGGFSVKTFTVRDSEESKSGEVFLKLLEDIARYDVSRRIVVVALGGGVIGDLAGFVAAVYKRGVPYVQVPTTLLAQIDSAIGGKTAIDLKSGKNLAGAFYQPKFVLSDVSVLKTLPRAQICNGLAEAVKYGVISDEEFFAFLEQNVAKILNCDSKTLTHIVEVSSQIKADVVGADEKEVSGLRMILNFGHTLGHAIEAVTLYKRYAHGEAIAIGMRAAGHMACAVGLWKQADFKRLQDLIADIGLPLKIDKEIATGALMKAMLHDKKFKGRTTRFILPTTIGRVQVVENIDPAIVQSAIQFCKKEGDT